MKKLFILFFLTIAFIGLFAFQYPTQDSRVVEKFMNQPPLAGGGQPGFTGAPFDANCTQCHLGSTQDGTSENALIFLDADLNTVTEYTPGSTYAVVLQMVSSPNRKGFSAVALDDNAFNAGSFTGDLAIGGTQDFSAGGRDYVSHTNTSNTSTQQSWVWSWDAPEIDVGDVKFYVASTSTNDDGTEFGDIIYLSQHVITTPSNVGIEENVSDGSSFTVGYAASNNSIIVDFNSLKVADMYVNLLDLSGESVYTDKMNKSTIGENKHSISLPVDIKNGIYVVHFFLGNRPMSAKVKVMR